MMSQAAPGSGPRRAGHANLPGDPLSGHVAGQAGLVDVGPGLCLAMFDLPALDPSARVQIDGTIDGATLPRPLLSTRLALRAGGTRCIVLVRHDLQTLAVSRLSFSVGERLAALVDPDWLQSPRRAPEDLIDGLAPSMGQRLVRFLLPNVASQVGREAIADFKANVLTLLDILGVARGALTSVCPAGRAGLILGYRVPRLPAPFPGSAFVLGPRGIEALTSLSSCVEGDGLVHLFLPRADRRQVVDLVLPGERPLLLAAPAKPLPLADIGAWLDRRPPEVQAWAEAILRGAASIDANAAAVLAERSVPPAATPEISRCHLAATRGGLLVAAEITDRHGVAAVLRIDWGPRCVEVPVPPGGHVRAFLPWQDKSGAGSPVVLLAPEHARLCLHGRSGRALATTTTRMTAFAGSVPDGFGSGNMDAACRAFAAAWRDRVPAAPVAQISACGPASLHDGPGIQPRLSLIVPLTADPDLIRTRAAMVACEPQAPWVEVDCVIAGRPVPQLLSLIAGVAQVTRVPHRVVCLPEGTCAADALPASLRVARAPSTLLLGSTVLPAGPGWLEPWLGSLDRLTGTGILGATLLSPDGSVHHAGGRLTWTSAARPHVALTGVGLPVADVAPDPLLRSDLFTVEAVGLSEAGRAAILAAGACLPDPDLALLPALLCAGAGQVSLRHRFVRYGSAAPPDQLVQGASLHLLGAGAEDGTPGAANDSPGLVAILTGEAA